MDANTVARLARALGRLEKAYPRQEITTQTGAIYAESLGDMPIEAIEQAIDRVIKTSRFFPTIAELRQDIAENLLSLPTAEEAAAEVFTTKYGMQKPWFSSGAIKAAYDAFGHFPIHDSETPEAVRRSQFLKAYDDIRNRALRDVMVSGTAALASGSAAIALLPQPTLGSLDRYAEEYAEAKSYNRALDLGAWVDAPHWDEIARQNPWGFNERINAYFVGRYHWPDLGPDKRSRWWNLRNTLWAILDGHQAQESADGHHWLRWLEKEADKFAFLQRDRTLRQHVERTLSGCVKDYRYHRHLLSVNDSARDVSKAIGSWIAVREAEAIARFIGLEVESEPDLDLAYSGMTESTGPISMAEWHRKKLAWLRDQIESVPF